MKLMQKILSHGLLIGFFVASFFTYMYRADLFPQWFGDTARTAALPARSQSPAPVAPPALPTGPADTVASAEPQSAAVEVASAVQPAEEAPTLHPGTPQDIASELPPLVSASDPDKAPVQAPAAAPDVVPEVVPSAAEPVASSESAADSAWQRAAPPLVSASDLEQAQAPAAAPDVVPEAVPSAAEPVASSDSVPDSAWQRAAPPPGPPQYRPLETATGTAPPVPVDTTAQDTMAPQPEPESVAPPVVAAPVQGEPVPGVQTDNAGTLVEAEPVPAPVSPVEIVRAPAPPPSVVVAPAAPPVPAAPPTRSPASSVQDFQQQLAVARNYFWRRDLRGALQAYQNLARVWPAQADAWGELGNLYLRIGNRQAAADAYYRTMTILLDQGNSERAYGLLEVLYGLDAARASEIEKRFRQASS